MSGDALSKVKIAETAVRTNNNEGGQMLTADQDLVQDLVQEDVVTDSDSSSEDEGGYNDVVPAAVPRRRRRVRAELLGPTVPQRLQQRR